MAKKDKQRGFDVVAEAQERAEHNINPYYWMNRITSRRLAEWAVQKNLAIIFAPFYVVILVLLVENIGRDFNGSSAPAAIAALLMFGLITIIEIIMAVQWWRSRGESQPQAEIPTPPKKKHQPKRRKDYH